MKKNLISFEADLKFVEVFEGDCGFEGEKGYVDKCTAIFAADGREERSAEILVSFIGSKAGEFMDAVDDGTISEGDFLSLKLNANTRFWVNEKDAEIPITEFTCWSFYAKKERRETSRRPERHETSTRGRRGENETNQPAYRNMPDEVPEVDGHKGTGRDGRSLGRGRNRGGEHEKKTESPTERRRYAPK